MAQERRQPLPAGRYWITAAGPKIQLFDGWAAGNRAFVKIENEQLTPATSSQPEINFYLFRTTQPLIWLTPLGFPNVAGPEIKQQSDTILSPPGGGLFDFGAFGDLDFGTVAIIAIAAYFLMSDHK